MRPLAVAAAVLAAVGPARAQSGEPRWRTLFEPLDGRDAALIDGRLAALDAAFAERPPSGPAFVVGTCIYRTRPATAKEPRATVVFDVANGLARPLDPAAGVPVDASPSGDLLLLAGGDSAGGRHWRRAGAGAPFGHVDRPLPLAGVFLPAWLPDESAALCERRTDDGSELVEVAVRDGAERVVWTLPAGHRLRGLALDPAGGRALVVAERSDSASAAGETTPWLVDRVAGTAVDLEAALLGEADAWSVVGALGEDLLLTAFTAGLGTRVVALDAALEPREVAFLEREAFAGALADGHVVLHGNGAVEGVQRVVVLRADGERVGTLALPALPTALWRGRASDRYVSLVCFDWIGPVQTFLIDPRGPALVDPWTLAPVSPTVETWTASPPLLGARRVGRHPSVDRDSAPLLPVSELATSGRYAELWLALGGVLAVRHGCARGAQDLRLTRDDLADRLAELDLVPVADAVERLAAD